MNTRQRKTRTGRERRAFTLVEALVVIIILGVLATLIVPRLVGRVGQSKTAVAESNAASIAKAMKTLQLDVGQLPEDASINILWECPSDVDKETWQGPYVDKPDDLLDPWGNQFVLVIPGEQNIDFDVVSYGRDAKPGGDDEDKDVVKP